MTPAKVARSVVEPWLRQLWCDILELPAVLSGDDFFLLGGTSVDMATVVRRTRDELGLLVSFNEALAAHGFDDMVGMIMGGAADDVTTGSPPTTTKHVSLSAVQQHRLRTIRRAADERAAKRMLTFSYLIDGDLDPKRFREAMTAVVARHEPLRLALPDLEPDTAALLDPESAMDAFTMLDLTAAPDVPSAVGAVLDRPIDYRRGRLFHAVLGKLGPRSHVFAYGVEHLVFDRASAAVLLRDLARAYTHPGSVSPSVDQSFWHAAAEQEARVRVRKGERITRYWHQLFDRFGIEPRLRLRERSPGSSSARGAAARVSMTGPVPHSSAYVAAFRPLGMTPFLLGLTGLLVADAAGATRDVGAVVPLDNRPDAVSQDLIGFFSHSVNVFVRLASDMTLVRAAEAVGTAFREAMENAGMPMAALYVQRNPNFADEFAPGAYLYCDFEDIREDEPTLGGATVTAVEASDAAPVKHHPTVHVVVNRCRAAVETLGFDAYYADAAFTGDTIREYLAHALAYVRAVDADPGLTLGELRAAVAAPPEWDALARSGHEVRGSIGFLDGVLRCVVPDEEEVLFPTALGLVLLRALAGELAGRAGPPRVLDIGSGSGIHSVAAAVGGARSVVAVDPNTAAGPVLAGNAELNGLAAAPAFFPGSLGDYLRTGPEPVDLILCNPPHFALAKSLDAQ